MNRRCAATSHLSARTPILGACRVRLGLLVALVGSSLVGPSMYASTIPEENRFTIHETVTISELLNSQGLGETTIASNAPRGDATNVVIEHELTGGYTANALVASGTVRAETLGGNFFRDAFVAITPNSGTDFMAFTSPSGAPTAIGELDTFTLVASSIFGAPNPNGGQFIEPGLARFEFFETADELFGGADNTILDLELGFYEFFADDGQFELGSLESDEPYVNVHSHVIAGRDFFRFDLPTPGEVTIITSPSTDGTEGVEILDTEIGLFGSNDELIAQNDDINLAADDLYSELRNLQLDAGSYTLVTTSFNSSLNDTLQLGDSIDDFTAGSDFGDYGLEILFTADDVPLSCDFDGDGDCDPLDLGSLYGGIADADGSFDLNGDGTVDSADIDTWLSQSSATENPFNENDVTFVRGDLDFNGTVNSTDLGLLLNNFNADDGPLYGGGDLNADQIVNSTDLGLLLNNFGQNSAVGSVVPEPAIPLPFLAVFSLIAVAGMRKGRKGSQI